MPLDVPGNARALSRRRVLLATAAVVPLAAAAGCTSAAEPMPTPTPTPDAVASVVADELELVAAYDAAIAAYPDVADALAVVRQQHLDHAGALAGGTAPTAPAPGTATAAPTVDGALAELISAERAALTARVAACVAASDAEAARTLAFVAASESAHVPYLRDLR